MPPNSSGQFLSDPSKTDPKKGLQLALAALNERLQGDALIDSVPLVRLQLGNDVIQFMLCSVGILPRLRAAAGIGQNICSANRSYLAFDLCQLNFCKVHKIRIPVTDQLESLTTILPMFPAPECRRSRSAAGAESSPSTKVSRLTNVPDARAGTISARRAGSSPK